MAKAKMLQHFNMANCIFYNCFSYNISTYRYTAIVRILRLRNFKSK
jgi:hypothetical protein